MRKTASSTCETSALRIQDCISKCLSTPPLALSVKLRAYQFVPPLKIKHIPLQKLKTSRKKSTSKAHVITKTPPSQQHSLALEPTQCSINQKYLHSLAQEKTLSAERVIPWQLKGEFLVCEALKTLAKQTQAGLSHHAIVSMKLSAEAPPENPYLQDPSLVNQQRHFQIDRVIPYLS